MRSSNTCRELVFGLALALCGAAHAMDPNRAMSQYVRDRWGPNNGFPRGPVYAIAQSSDGYLWAGTQAGLVRFDGLEFQLIRDVPGMRNGESVLGLMPDRNGSLWIRLEGTLLRYRDGIFDKPAAPLIARMTALSQTKDGDLLVAMMEHGSVAYRENKLEKVTDTGGLPRSPVLAIAQTQDGSIWSGTRGAGLFRQRDGQTFPVSDGLRDPKINCLVADSNGDLWAGTDSGIVRWNGTQLVAVGAPSLGNLQVLALERDRDGNIWAGTDSRGLIRINGGGVSYLDPGEQPREAVTALFEDREGNLWVGSANGIERLRDSAFVTYSSAEGLPTDGSNPVFVGSDGRMWFSPVNGGLWWTKDGRHGVVSVGGLDRDVVYSIAGSDGELWLGRRRGGLTVLRTDVEPFTARTYTKADGLAQDNIFSVYQAHDGTVWAGTLTGGVSELSGERFTTYTTANGLLSNNVASILEGSDETMWFGTSGGLNAFSKGRWQGFTQKNGLPSDNIYCLLEDSTRVLWVGTAAGLASRSAGQFQIPKGVPALLREPILGMAEDKFGDLWIATAQHVLRVNREKLQRNRLEEGDLREFGTADGLRGVEGVRRNRSVIVDPKGQVWFSLDVGISVVDPARLARNTVPTIVHPQTILADGATVPMLQKARVPAGSKRITFGYAGLGLSAPELIRFRYRLDPYDAGWIDGGHLRDASYTNLSPGAYRFRVVASSPDGAWNSNEGVVNLEVAPLWWQTWEFRVAIGLSFVAAALALYRLRLREMAARLNLRFEERLAERTRIAQELHDTLLQGFISASMQVHVAADWLPDDSQAKPTLTRAMQLMRQVIDEGRNAVRGLRSSTSLSLDLAHAFSRVQNEIAPVARNGQQVEFRVIVDGQQMPLNPLLRDEVYRIGREALINAFRHANAKKIEVELKYSRRELRVLVRDNGCGIEPVVLKSGRDGHWGLSGMRGRAEQIGAHLHVYSSAALGTEIDLSVPGQVAFENQTRRRFGRFGKQEPVHKGKSE
ncbi:MAG TPA: two-component regulator propeller domain-containing protein [Bryobacteraceae bacterium]|nr:two-component regulator propeller domain-containing protein [Bryobacteraceae bacterium]